MSANKDSIEAMIDEATRQGWLSERTLAFIPELSSIYEKAAEHFLDMVRNADFSQYRETMVFHICRYLFAKGVEGVILWGGSKDGKISVYFHPKHFTDKFETEVPAKYHSLVEDSMKTGVSLFKAHQEWVIQKQNAKAEIDLSKEIEEVIKWIPRFGIAFALHNKYQALLADPLDTSKQ